MTMAQKKSVLIVDDHPLFREGLKTIIGRDMRFEIVGEAGSGDEGFQMAGQLEPDMVVMDISLPDKTGIQLTREILGLLPETRIMIVSIHSEIDYITEAFQAGVTGYVVKESASERLLNGLESVSRGDYFLDNAVSTAVVDKLKKVSAGTEDIINTGYGVLTTREQEVLRLVAEGLSSKDAAEKLSISPNTVRNHRCSIMKKLDLHSVAELVHYSARLGLIDMDTWEDLD